MTNTVVHHSYDEVPYPSQPFVHSHPAHLAALATLLGMNPPPVEGCRVLELGSADGGNLIPMAEELPQSTFVGIDLSALQIASGRAIADALGLDNISLTPMNILDVDERLGQFDYIIAHGIYSWVPPEVRDQLLAVCKRNLAPNGVAYVSYNTYPGWRMLGTIRDIMLYHTQALTDPSERAKRALELLDFLSHLPQETKREGKDTFAPFLAAYATSLKQTLDGMGTSRDRFLLHDVMEAVNDPIYFAQFADHAARHGLQYLAEAEFPSVLPSSFSPQVFAWVRQQAGDLIQMEQYVDFLRGRTFRKTLLCHADVAVDRTFSADRLATLHVASSARPVVDEAGEGSSSVARFRSSDGATLTTDHPVSQAAMEMLGKAWPRTVPFAALLAEGRAAAGSAAEDEERDAAALSGSLIQGYLYSKSLVDLRAHPVQLAEGISQRPVARPLARVQAQLGVDVTNMYHINVQLQPFSQYLLPLLDGSRDWAALLATMSEAVAGGAVTLPIEDTPTDGQISHAQIMEVALEQNLRWLYSAALLVG
jgi:methyltransferase-like protein/2-polyprenyl-3-methyl-5-hydroxy-6-metoxy-1,4-benzoquinol methylase